LDAVADVVVVLTVVVVVVVATVVFVVDVGGFVVEVVVDVLVAQEVIIIDATNKTLNPKNTIFFFTSFSPLFFPGVFSQVFKLNQ
jgi:hypothetical protein